jgi:hypothetical protein
MLSLLKVFGRRCNMSVDWHVLLIPQTSLLELFIRGLALYLLLPVPQGRKTKSPWGVPTAFFGKSGDAYFRERSPLTSTAVT